MPAKSLLLVGFALLTGSAALAENAPPQKPKEQRICRDAEPNLGSHIRSSRRCLTAEEWQREDEAKAQTPLSMRVTEGQDHPSTTPR